jgi:hypothetical protein
MPYPRRFVALAFIFLATLLSVGVVHGLWIERWSSRTSSQEILEMNNLPLSVGAWEGKSLSQGSDEQIFPDSSKFLLRRYVNHGDQYNGAAASVMLTRGRPGPMVTLHLPIHCYPSAGYDLVGPPKRFLSQSPDSAVPDEFWVATFKKGADDFPVTVRVHWSWSATGQWQTPDRPRMTFSRYWVLYKLYVVQNIRDEDEESEAAPVHDLIKELTRAMRSSIFSAGPK